jgi:ferredoxin-NADP reductase
MKYTTKLTKKEEIASGTMAFYFEKPAGFEYTAGQYVDITLKNPPETDAEGDTRSFTLTSAPSEAELCVAMRMRDTAFKRVLKDMAIGTEVEIDGPMGIFTLPDDSSQPVVFLMGGIGVTPARSMCIEAAVKNLPHSLCLFYSNKRPEDTAFLGELSGLGKKNPKYKFVGTMTEMIKSKEPWSGETGMLNAEIIKKYIEDVTKPVWYISGPPAMVSAMCNTLQTLNVAKENIKTEEFSGY